MKVLLARSFETRASLTASMIVCMTASSFRSTSTIAVRRSPFSLGRVPVRRGDFDRRGGFDNLIKRRLSR